MVFESHEMLGKLRQHLCEAVGKVPFGTMVGWRTPGGRAYGVVVGMEGKELLALTTYDKTLKKDRGLKYYRDEALSDKLAPLMPSVVMDLQRVPASKAFKHGRITGAALKPYTTAAKHLQLEGRSESMNFTEANKRLEAIRQSFDEEGPLTEGRMFKSIDGAISALKLVKMDMGSGMDIAQHFKGAITHIADAIEVAAEDKHSDSLSDSKARQVYRDLRDAAKAL